MVVACTEHLSVIAPAILESTAYHAYWVRTLGTDTSRYHSSPFSFELLHHTKAQSQGRTPLDGTRVNEYNHVHVLLDTSKPNFSDEITWYVKLLRPLYCKGFFQSGMFCCIDASHSAALTEYCAWLVLQPLHVTLAIS